ncbi:MAG: hypothetical protein WA532_08415, partial [Candidatus Korobacteraceae bacterium]
MTSVVPQKGSFHAALAAEGQLQAIYETALSLLNRSAAAASVSGRLQNAKRTCCEPRVLSFP